MSDDPRHAPSDPAPEHTPEPAEAEVPAPGAQDEDILTGALDEDDAEVNGDLVAGVEEEVEAQPEGPDEQALAAAARQSARAPTTPAHRPRQRGVDLKELAVPLFITVGVLLLVPGVWAILVLAGAGVPGADRPDAKIMGGVMLSALPISGALLAAAVLFWRQVRRQKAAYAATTAGKTPAPGKPATPDAGRK